jgi:hypothetical protein
MHTDKQRRQLHTCHVVIYLLHRTYKSYKSAYIEAYQGVRIFLFNYVN